MRVADRSMWCYLKAVPENSCWNDWLIRVAYTRSWEKHEEVTDKNSWKETCKEYSELLLCSKETLVADKSSS